MGEKSIHSKENHGKKEEDRYNSFFSNYRRFSFIVIVRISALLIVCVILYAEGLALFAIIPAILVVLTILMRSLYVYQRRQPDDKVLVGGKCLVIKSISKQERGIVKVYKKKGWLDHELWSAETNNGERVEEGTDSKIVGLRSIILLVEPIQM